jgi:hypothetical protein
MESKHIRTVFNEVSSSLKEIYNKRKRTLFFQKIMWAITGLFFLLIFLNMAMPYLAAFNSSFLETYHTIFQSPYSNLYPFIILVVLLYPALFFFTNSFKKFTEKEHRTIDQMIKMLFPKVEFTQIVKAPIKEITNSKIFAWVDKETTIVSYGQIRSNSDNSVVNIVDIGFIEDNVGNKLSRGLMMVPGLNILVILWNYVFKNVFTNKTTDNVYYSFRGMFSWLVYPKKLNGHTVVLTNNQKQKTDRLASFNFKEEQKVLLEDARFTNKFLVYSTDQVEARYVLSAAVMERILALEEKFKRNILLSFHNKKMYLAVENTYGLFSFPSGKLDDIKIIEELVNDIETALYVSTSLNKEKQH